MAAVEQLIVLHFPQLPLKLFSCIAAFSMICGSAVAIALLIIAIIVATVYSFQLWQQQRLCNVPRKKAKTESKQKEETI